MNRRQSAALSLLLLCAACALACGGGSQPAQGDLPPLDLNGIRRNIDGRYVRVPSADGKSEPIDWVFDPSEPKEIEIVEQKIEGDRATFLVNMRTHTVPRSRKPRSLSGQLRLHYRLRSGLVLRGWEIEEVENVSFTYTNEPPPSPTAETKKGEGGDGEDARGATGSNANAQPGDKTNANAKPGAKGANRNQPARP
jgi:hypothetical protein